MAVDEATIVGSSGGISVAATAKPTDCEVRSLSAAELRIVYLATPDDTSCVSHDEDDSCQQAAVSVGSNVPQHTVMNIDGSDDDEDEDDDVDTEVSQHSVIDTGTSTMLQRN